MITYNEFIKKYEGKTYDYDGISGCQCVDTAKLYCDKCLGLKPKAYGNAKDWWLRRQKYKFFTNNFEFITLKKSANNPYFTQMLRKGDIGIRVRGTYGHIFIIDNTSETNITYYDTNGTGHHDPLTKRIVPYTPYYITGVLRPKTHKKIVSAKIGLRYYSSLTDNNSCGVIPYKETVKVLIDNAGTKKIGNKEYKMSIIFYNDDFRYCARCYLK